MPERRETDRTRTGSGDGQGPGLGDGERIAKYLASAGVASRRDVEKLIAEGRVSVDGRVLDTPAFKVTGREKISVDGQAVGGVERTRLWRYHKPQGLVTTNRDPEGRPTIFERLPKDLPRVVTIGRLDLNTEGLLLLTNDGELARALELPATGLERRYRARAYGRVEQRELDRLRDGLIYEGVEYRSIIATLDTRTGANSWIDMTLTEGKKREARRALESLGMKVNRLIRVSYGPIELGDLPLGEVAEVPPVEVLGEFHEIIAEHRRPDLTRPRRQERSARTEPQPDQSRRERPDARSNQAGRKLTGAKRVEREREQAEKAHFGAARRDHKRPAAGRSADRKPGAGAKPGGKRPPGHPGRPPRK